MSLSTDLISQFAKVTNDNSKREKGTAIAYATVVSRGDIMYVQLDGSDVLTPVSSTVSIRDGERVTVMIKNHIATITGNITSPAANSEDNIDAAKIATNYIDLSDDHGLVIGDRTRTILRGNIQLKTESDGVFIALRDNKTILTKISETRKAYTGITSAFYSSSSSTITTEDEDGTESSETMDDIEQTVYDSQTKQVIKFESSNPVYFSNGITTDKILINDENFISNTNITLNGSIFDADGKIVLEPVTSNGNLSIGYGRYKFATASSTDFSTLYGNRVRLYTKNGASIVHDGRVALDTLNNKGNMVIGYHLKKMDSGNLNLYAATGGTITANNAIVPASNASLSLGKHNELGWSNVYIGVTDGTYNGLQMIHGGKSLKMCGRDDDGRFIFGNNENVIYYVSKNVDTTTTGDAFKFTSGTNDADNGTESVWFFGASDATSRYIGSYIAYNRTYTNTANMCVTSNGIFGRSTSSSKRYKRDIADADINDLKGLYNLPIKKFKYKNDYISEDDELYDKYLYGFIVEDLESVLPCAVQHEIDEDGTVLPEMWNSNIIVPSLLKLIQDLNIRFKHIEEGV